MAGERCRRFSGETGAIGARDVASGSQGLKGATVAKIENGSCEQRIRRIPYAGTVIMKPRDGGERIKGEGRDLSMGGMFIKTVLPFNRGSVIDVQISMKPLNYHGAARVLWTRYSEAGEDQPYGMAVEWVDLTVNQKRLLFRQIDDYVRGGGELLVGTPDAEREAGPAARAVAASAVDAPSNRTRLIIGIALAAVAVVVALLVFT